MCDNDPIILVDHQPGFVRPFLYDQSGSMNETPKRSGDSEPRDWQKGSTDFGDALSKLAPKHRADVSPIFFITDGDDLNPKATMRYYGGHRYSRYLGYIDYDGNFKAYLKFNVNGGYDENERKDDVGRIDNPWWDE